MRLRSLLTVACASVAVAGCSADPAAAEPAPALTSVSANSPVCGLWLAIGDSPTDEELVDAARRYAVVVLNAWEVRAQRRLRELDPSMTVLVYKDLSSTRSYAEAADHDGLLPTGVSYASDPQWFATDTAGSRIEWGPYPGHWQMAVWDPGYQRAWTAAVAAETTRNGWDGVFADNDFADLGFYADAVLDGTSGREESNRKIRDGLDELVTTAGTALEARGKLLIPNLSEARLYPGRWTEHARFGGATEENFALYADSGLITWQGDQWSEMLRTGSDAKHLNLLVTKTGDDVEQSRDGAAERAGFAGAALLAGDRTCWSSSPTGDYARPGWSGYQSLDLGEPTARAARDDSGVWTREFDGGWVALNPGADDASVAVPSGLRTAGGEPVTEPVVVAAADAVILVR